MTGAAGVYEKPSSQTPGLKNSAAYVLNIRRSTLSVILPPYWTSLTMYWSVLQEMGPAYRWPSKNKIQAVKSAVLYSYLMHQPAWHGHPHATRRLSHGHVDAIDANFNFGSC